MKQIEKNDPRYTSFLLGLMNFFSFEPWSKLNLFNVYDQGKFNGLIAAVWEDFPAVIEENEDENFRASEIMLCGVAKLIFHIDNYDEIYMENTGSSIYLEGFNETYQGDEAKKISAEAKERFEKIIK